LSEFSALPADRGIPNLRAGDGRTGGGRGSSVDHPCGSTLPCSATPLGRLAARKKLTGKTIFPRR